MLFNSYEFLLLIAAGTILFFLLPHSEHWLHRLMVSTCIYTVLTSLFYSRVHVSPFIAAVTLQVSTKFSGFNTMTNEEVRSPDKTSLWSRMSHHEVAQFIATKPRHVNECSGRGDPHLLHNEIMSRVLNWYLYISGKTI